MCSFVCVYIIRYVQRMPYSTFSMLWPVDELSFLARNTRYRSLFYLSVVSCDMSIGLVWVWHYVLETIPYKDQYPHFVVRLLVQLNYGIQYLCSSVGVGVRIFSRLYWEWVKIEWIICLSSASDNKSAVDMIKSPRTVVFLSKPFVVANFSKYWFWTQPHDLWRSYLRWEHFRRRVPFQKSWNVFESRTCDDAVERIFRRSSISSLMESNWCTVFRFSSRPFNSLMSHKAVKYRSTLLSLPSPVPVFECWCSRMLFECVRFSFGDWALVFGRWCLSVGVWVIVWSTNSMMQV